MLSRFQVPYVNGMPVWPADFVLSYDTGETARVIHNTLKYRDVLDENDKVIGEAKDGFTFASVIVAVFAGGWVSEGRVTVARTNMVVDTTEANVDDLKARPAYTHIEDIPDPDVGAGGNPGPPIDVPIGGR